MHLHRIQNFCVELRERSKRSLLDLSHPTLFGDFLNKDGNASIFYDAPSLQSLATCILFLLFNLGNLSLWEISDAQQLTLRPLVPAFVKPQSTSIWNIDLSPFPSSQIFATLSNGDFDFVRVNCVLREEVSETVLGPSSWNNKMQNESWKSKVYRHCTKLHFLHLFRKWPEGAPCNLRRFLRSPVATKCRPEALSALGRGRSARERTTGRLRGRIASGRLGCTAFSADRPERPALRTGKEALRRRWTVKFHLKVTWHQPWAYLSGGESGGCPLPANVCKQ